MNCLEFEATKNIQIPIPINCSDLEFYFKVLHMEKLKKNFGKKFFPLFNTKSLEKSMVEMQFFCP